MSGFQCPVCGIFIKDEEYSCRQCGWVHWFNIIFEIVFYVGIIGIGTWGLTASETYGWVIASYIAVGFGSFGTVVLALKLWGVLPAAKKKRDLWESGRSYRDLVARICWNCAKCGKSSLSKVQCSRCRETFCETCGYGGCPDCRDK